jgi:hypothetical protein
MILNVYILTKTPLGNRKITTLPLQEHPVVLVAGEQSFVQLEAVPLFDDETP